jgi:aryl-alcohol dehydrogenase-like predicted oxidoreductase
MQMRPFGRLGSVSAVSFGGGGIGGVYGAVARAEAVATVRAAVDAGITLLDLAPTYGPGEQTPDAELIVGDAFAGRPPDGVGVTTKVMLTESMPPDSLVDAMQASLRASLDRVGAARADLLFLHSYVRPSHLACGSPEVIDIATVRNVVRPELERLAQEGLIRGWGLTGIGHPDAICELLDEEPRPAAVQCVTNALDSAGDMWPFGGGEQPDNLRIRHAAARAGVPVMGIRAVAAGALTDRIDRPTRATDAVAVDYQRASAFRRLASRLNLPSAQLAYRYALSVPGVSTVVVGAKTPTELAACLAAEAAGPLDDRELAAVERACSSLLGTAT